MKFFFGVLPSKYSGSAWGFNADSAEQKSFFLEERIFRFASADFPLGFAYLSISFCVKMSTMAKRTIKKILTMETKYGSFQCVFEPEKDMGGYVVEARGVPGAISWGKTHAEAKRMIVEAIEGAVEAGVVAKAEKKGIVQIKNIRHSAPIS